MEFIVDLKDLERYTHLGIVETKKAIESGCEKVITPNILLCNYAIKHGYLVYVNNYEDYYEFKNGFSQHMKHPHDIIVGNLVKNEINIDLSEFFNQGGIIVEYYNRQLNDFYKLSSRVKDNVNKFMVLYDNLYKEFGNEEVKPHPLYRAISDCLDYDGEINISLKLEGDYNGDLAFTLVYNYGKNRKYRELFVPNDLAIATNGDVDKFAKILFDKSIKAYETSIRNKKEKEEKEELELYKKLKKKYGELND